MTGCHFDVVESEGDGVLARAFLSFGEFEDGPALYKGGRVGGSEKCNTDIGKVARRADNRLRLTCWTLRPIRGCLGRKSSM